MAGLDWTGLVQSHAKSNGLGETKPIQSKLDIRSHSLTFNDIHGDASTLINIHRHSLTLIGIH
eukprot:3168777-Lingulodinium_polyedra.AAC.1